MQWTKIQKRFEELLAPSLRGRLRIRVTKYREASRIGVGRGWITIDGKQVISIEIPSFYDNSIYFSTDTLNLGRAVGAYIGMSIDAARSSPDPVLRGLAFLDKRFGKRSLAAVDEVELHDFEKALYAARCRAEGIDRHAHQTISRDRSFAAGIDGGRA